MTMPLQFDKSAYLKVLREAGVAPELAGAHAEAIESGLTQPIVLPADLALLKPEILARMDERLKEFKAEILARMDERLKEFKAEVLERMDERLKGFKAEILMRMDEKFVEFEARILAKVEGLIDKKLRPVYLMSSMSLALSMVSIVLNCIILSRL
jgi:hypothetical protein